MPQRGDGVQADMIAMAVLGQELPACHDQLAKGFSFGAG
jgi:hypothetical protein